MDWSLLIFVITVAVFAWRGYRIGLLGSMSRVFALLAGYAAAILFTGSLADVIAARFDLQGIAGLAAASLMLFLGAAAAVAVLFWLLRRFVFRAASGSRALSVGGGAVGALMGVLIAFVIVWTFAFVRDMTPWDETAAPERPASSGVEKLANRLAGQAVGAALSAGSADSEMARLGSALVASPAEITQRAQRLMASAELQALLQDRRNLQVLDSGDVDLVRRLPAFRVLLANADLVALAEATGLAAGDDLELVLATRLTDTWRRSQQVKHDPRVQAILADAEFRKALDSGNPVTLLANPRLLEVADIIFEGEEMPAAPDQPIPGAGTTADTTEEGSSETRIYQWTDSSGRVYFSDQKPAD